MQTTRGKTRNSTKEPVDDSKTLETTEENPSKRQKTSEQNESTTKPTIASNKKALTQVRASFCMKLFDRSVDLSKFDVDSPLYPICREWMKNVPRNKQRIEQADVKEEILPRKDAPEVLRMIQNGIQAEIKFLPPVDYSLGMTKVPELLNFQKDLDKNKLDVRHDNKPGFGKDDLLKRHRKRWTLVRDHWQSHAKDYSAQYAGSFEILDAIFKK